MKPEKGNKVASGLHSNHLLAMGHGVRVGGDESIKVMVSYWKHS